MKRILFLAATAGAYPALKHIAPLLALAGVSFAQNPPAVIGGSDDGQWHRLSPPQQSAPPTALSVTRTESLAGIRFSEIRVVGTPAAADIINFYTPRVLDLLRQSGIQGSGDPRDYILAVNILNACKDSVCGGAVMVSVMGRQQVA